MTVRFRHPIPILFGEIYSRTKVSYVIVAEAHVTALIFKALLGFRNGRRPDYARCELIFIGVFVQDGGRKRAHVPLRFYSFGSGVWIELLVGLFA
jgi:hypothetical protein